MKIRKGDKVLIIKGKDRGKSGKILKVLVKKSKVLIEGLNLIKKSIKAKRQGEKGQIVTVPSPVAIANVQLVCSACGKPARVGWRFAGNRKERYCKKCGATN
jgi:large subunit ribosomal protein L24